MSCPYCGGYHGGVTPGPPPPVTTPAPNIPIDRTKEQMAAIVRAGRADPYERDVLPGGDGKLWEPRIYGTDESGQEVTAAFGKTGTAREGEILISSDHRPGWDFFGPKDNKGHDHSGPQGMTERGQYLD
jgi:hypothetical protein